MDRFRNEFLLMVYDRVGQLNFTLINCVKDRYCAVDMAF